MRKAGDIDWELRGDQYHVCYEPSGDYFARFENGGKMMHCKLKRTRHATARAITLIELLVVLAIIAILAGLLFPAFGRMQAFADRAKCASNLRQVGAAMSGYLGEHDGVLPGPLWVWQNPWFKSGDYGGLGTVLAKYLKLTPIGTSQRADVLMCPAWQRGAPYQPGTKGQDEQYIMNWAVQVGSQQINPWGDADLVFDNGNLPLPGPYDGDKPRPLASFANKDATGKIVSLSTTWAMQDLDQTFVREYPTTPPNVRFYGIAPKPVHGYVRNALYFDFHVEAIPVPPRFR